VENKFLLSKQGHHIQSPLLNILCVVGGKEGGALKLTSAILPLSSQMLLSSLSLVHVSLFCLCYWQMELVDSNQCSSLTNYSDKDGEDPDE